MFDGCCGGMGGMMAWGWIVGVLLIGLLVAVSCTPLPAGGGRVLQPMR